MTRPGESPCTERTPRVVAARRLARRAHRSSEERFLAEGPQAVREALARAEMRTGQGTLGDVSAVVAELFATVEALERHADLAEQARRLGIAVSEVTDRAMVGLSETVHPQGLVAVCTALDVPLGHLFPGAGAPPPRLVAVLVDVRDPGNAGTVLRAADAAGAAAVIFAGDAVDPYNGKCVRASAGSLFHLPVVRGVPVDTAVRDLRGAGLRVLAADAAGEQDLDDLLDAGALAAPSAWLFGNEAWGLPHEVAASADVRVRVPIYGRAESLNVAAATAVCLYASARAQRPYASA